jgi:hypothetical protein
VLGPDAPLAKSIKFIENYGFFGFLGLQYSRENRHQSRHLRPTPPSGGAKKWKKVKISLKISFIDKFITTHGSGK